MARSMIGAFAGLLAITQLAPPLFAVILALAFGALAGFWLERIAFRPFRRFRDEASLKSKANPRSDLAFVAGGF